MERRITMRPTGTIMAPPIPCRKRAATKKTNEVDNPHSIELAMKTQWRCERSLRPPKRSAIQPEIGMNTARLTR